MNKPIIRDTGTLDGVPYVRLSDTGNFSVFKTFDCGQCFRFDPSHREGEPYAVSGVAMGRHVTFREEDDGFTVVGADEKDFHTLWEKYLSLDVDYGEIDLAVISALERETRSCAAPQRCRQAYVF